ncbi:unnamed protein product [Gongylonema pulchrum]|uniref:AGC-kinase C-terminal domain-containing protein n=1 Tax=Gongylonema pulchrum TaxID=637853 RepID=A0A183CVZ9_9BILA|nr:unnamed protein product [Gongylonema pulchrum]
MQNRSLGVPIFPNKRSDAILNDPALLHFGSPGKFSRPNTAHSYLGLNLQNVRKQRQACVPVEKAQKVRDAILNAPMFLQSTNDTIFKLNKQEPTNIPKGRGTAKRTSSESVLEPASLSNWHSVQDLMDSSKRSSTFRDSFKEKQRAIAAVIQRQPPFAKTGLLPGIRDGERESCSDGTANGYEILKDLDNALDSDEHMPVQNKGWDDGAASTFINRFVADDTADKFIYFPTPVPNFSGFGSCDTVAGASFSIAETTQCKEYKSFG